MIDFSSFVLAQFMVQSMDLPTAAWTFIWVLPISISIAVVYKAVRVEPFETKLFVREVFLSMISLLGFLLAAAVILLVVHLFARG